MYRKSIFPWFGTACALSLAFVLACDKAPSVPTTPSSAVGGDGNAAADGSTLKASAPTPVSPINDFRLSGLRATMVITNATGKFSSRPFSYEFQLMNDAGTVIRTVTLAAGATTTSWGLAEDLGRDTPYRWRARAILDGAFGPWSVTVRFLTVREPRTPDPPPGQQLPLPNRANVVSQVAAENFDLLVHFSCQEHDPINGWRFLDKLIDTLRLEDTRWGYNCKRGNCNDPSLDVIVYHWGPGPDQGSPDVYALDVIQGHCGPNPAPIWNNITDPFGAGARFTSRGRW